MKQQFEVHQQLRAAPPAQLLREARSSSGLPFMNTVATTPSTIPPSDDSRNGADPADTRAPPALASARARILAAAVRTFAARGYAQTNVVDIVAAARMSKRTFYEVFTCKLDVFTEMLGIMAADFRREMGTQSGNTGDSREIATQIALAYLRVAGRFPTIAEQALGTHQAARGPFHGYLDEVLKHFELATETAERSRHANCSLDRSALRFLLRGLDQLVTSGEGEAALDAHAIEDRVRALIGRMCVDART